MFFSKYPKINYPYKIGDHQITKQIVDISANVRLDPNTLNDVVNYNYAALADGETPEIVSYNMYGTTFNHHLVVIANDKYDWRESTPLTSTQFESYVNEKYANPYGIHHYEDLQGNEVDNTYGDDKDFAYPKNVIPITNYEYEMRLNEAKRPIKIIKPQYTEVVNSLITSSLK